MIYFLVSDDELLRRMVSETLLRDQEVWSWAGRRRQGAPGGADRFDGPGTPFYGDPADPATYAGIASGRATTGVVCLRDGSRTVEVVEAFTAGRPEARVLVPTLNGEAARLRPPAERNGSREPTGLERVRAVPWAQVVGEGLETELARLGALERVRDVRARLDPAENVALLLQPDPDPDGIASGLALRQILRRNRATAPLLTLAPVSRPENVAMLRLLEIDLEVVQPADLARFERVALLDVQPNVFAGALDSVEVDVVIDHHPERKGYRAGFRDIRSSYGATSTILTEYCLAAEVAIPERLATALLYGIKSDTLFLDREATGADVHAFCHLYPLANTNLLRRIEKPELPRSAFSAFARALQRIDLARGLAYVHLGAVEREDVIPQMAELGLQLEGAEWSVASGLWRGRLVVCVRNAGYQKAAGTVVKELLGEIGSAGGHQAMAKAVVPLAAFRRRHGSTRAVRIREVLVRGMLERLG